MCHCEQGEAISFLKDGDCHGLSGLAMIIAVSSKVNQFMKRSNSNRYLSVAHNRFRNKRQERRLLWKLLERKIQRHSGH